MRFLPTARIVVLDPNAEHRTAMCKSLAELGLIQLLQASTLKEAQQLGQERPVDLCVVHAQAFESSAERHGSMMVPNPFVDDGAPAILLSSDTSRAATREAAVYGYFAVVALPVVPRVLYRRIGSILQKVRRSGRIVGNGHLRSGIGARAFSDAGGSVQAPDD